MLKFFSGRTSSRRFLISLTIILAVLSSAPYLYGYLRQTSELQYLGLHGFAPGDTFVYYSYLWQARDGHLAFADLYTTESGAPILNTFWLAAGWLGNLFNFSIPLTFHLARLLAIILVVYALWVLLSRSLDDARLRQWGMIGAIFASGISGYFLPFFHPESDVPGYYHLPLDLWVAEANVFTSALHSGHFLAALAGIVVVFVFFLTAVERRTVWWSVAAGISALALFSFHPFHVPLIFSTLVVFGVVVSMAQRKIRWDILRYVIVVALIALPVLAYYAVVMTNDSLTIGRAARNVMRSPAWYLLLLSYGWLLPGAAFGVRRLLATREILQPRWLLMLSWLAVQTFFLLVPVFPFQRRMVTGLQLPLVLLTLYGLPLAGSWLQQRLKRGYAVIARSLGAQAAVFVLLFGFSNMVNLANDLGLMQQRHPLVFWPAAEVEAIAAVRDATDEQSVVLADPITGYLIPGLTGRRVVAGHQDVETLDYEQKSLAINWFYAGGKSLEDRRRLLRQYGVTHVFAGPREVGEDFSSVAALPFLQEIWRNDVARLYRVIR